MEEETMTTIEFRVEGLPPKKDGANSMWGKCLESQRLVSLRRTALEKMGGRPPLKRDINLTLSVNVGAKNDRLVGDLDNFVTGICDGLMKMAPRCKPCREIWDSPENGDVRPSIPIAIEDDSQVIGIRATKIVGGGSQFYDVTLEGE